MVMCFYFENVCFDLLLPAMNVFGKITVEKIMDFLGLPLLLLLLDICQAFS